MITTWFVKMVMATVLLSASAQAADPEDGSDAQTRSGCGVCETPEGKTLAHCRRKDASLQPPEMATPSIGDNFTLRSASGPVDLVSLRGQVVLIYFGYTWCPDICPTNLAMIAGALKSLQPEEAAQVRVLFVSVDPERDDLPRLAEYAAYFHPNIIGVTGTPEQLANAAKRYGASYRRVDQPASAMGYMVDHSADTYVVDGNGRYVRAFDHATRSPEILAAIRSLLVSE